jgi:hypothetical protein
VYRLQYASRHDSTRQGSSECVHASISLAIIRHSVNSAALTQFERAVNLAWLNAKSGLARLILTLLDCSCVEVTVAMFLYNMCNYAFLKHGLTESYLLTGAALWGDFLFFKHCGVNPTMSGDF